MKDFFKMGMVVGLGCAAIGCAQPKPAVVEAPPAPEPVRDVLTAEAQAALTPEQVLADLKEFTGKGKVLQTSLTKDKEDELRKVIEPPRGPWIVCGAGRFGSRMIKQLEKSGLPFTVVMAPGGRVVLRHAGELARAELEPLLRELIDAG